MKRTVFALACAVSGFAVFAAPSLTKYYWSGGTGCWTNSSWSASSGGAFIEDFYPGKNLCEQVLFTSTGAPYVTLPEGDFSTHANFMLNLNSGRQMFTLDGRDSVFLMGASDSDNWDDSPFSVRYFDSSMLFNMQLHTVKDRKYTRALLVVTNGLMTAVVPQSNSMSLDFKEGEWNFYDPVPDQTPTEEVALVCFGGTSRGHARIFVDGENGAKMRFPSLYIRGNCLTNDFTIAGGEHEIMGRFQFPHDNCDGRATDTRFTVTSNALLSAAGITTFGFINSYYNTSNRVYTVLAENGGEIRFRGQVYTPYVCDVSLEARDGGKLVFGDGADTVHYLGGNNLVTARVNVVDSELDMTDSFVLGGKYTSGTITGNPLSYAYLYASNSVVNTGTGADGERRLYIVNGEVEMHDSDWTSHGLYLGYAGASSKLTVKSGKFRQVGKTIIGNQTGGKAELSFEGGESVISNTVLSEFQFGAAAGESVIRLSGGKLTLDFPLYANYFVAGYAVGSTGTIYQTGGEMLVKGDEGLCLGYGGVGVYEMQGGTLTTDQMRLGMQAHQRGETVFRQTGGFVSVTTTSEPWKGLNVCDKNINGRLVLDGGVMQCHSIRGWNGSTAKGGTGWAALEADGGTLRNFKNSGYLIYDFDEAKLGTAGLTVESDYAATIAQAFTDKDGEEGLLALTGSGVKTLTATNSSQSRLTATGGIVKFAQTDGVNASHFSHAAFSGGSGVSLEGSQTEVRFRSLAFDDQSGDASRIVLDPGDVIVSESVITDLGQIEVTFTGSVSAGATYAVIRCKGEASAGVIADWAAKTGLGSSKPDGAGADFTAEYDEEADETVFSVSFKAYSGEAPEDVVSGTTAVSGVMRAEAVHLNSQSGSAISGEGTLILNDTGYPSLVVESGSHVISVDMSLPAGGLSEAAISGGASLDISGTIFRGGLEKTGEGMLELSGENALDQGFVHGGGMTVLKTGDSAGPESVTVRDGTLAFAQAEGEMRLAALVKIDPAVSPSNAVVFKTDCDAVIGMVSPVTGAGALIKRGAGRLTVEEDGFVYPVMSSGYSKYNHQYSPDVELAFPEDGTVPDDFPYSGINVAEGELRFKGTSDAAPVTDKVNAFKSQVSVAVGLNVRGVTAAPGMVLDNAVCNFNAGSRHLNVGAGLANDIYGDGDDPYLFVTNGSSLIVNTLNFAWGSTHPGVKPRMEVDSSTVTCTYMFHPNRGAYVPLEHEFRNGSALYAEITFDHVSTLVFDDSVYAKNSSLAPGCVAHEWGNNCANYSKGTLVFRNGAEFRCNEITVSENPQYPVKNPMTIRFNNGKWIPASTNYVFSGALVGDPEKMIFEAEGAGLVLAPGAGVKWTLDVPLAGEGGLVKRGGGELAILQSAVEYSGVTRIEEGVISLEGQTLSGLTVSGPGTLTDGTLANTTFKVTLSDGYESGETPFLGENLTLGGGVRVDVGRSAENPLAPPFGRFAIARYDPAGQAPGAGFCRIRNSGLESLNGKVECEDGVVYVTPCKPNFVITLR